MIPFDELSRALDRYRARKTGTEVVPSPLATPGRAPADGPPALSPSAAATAPQAHSSATTVSYAAATTATYANALPASLDDHEGRSEVTKVQAIAPAAATAAAPTAPAPRGDATYEIDTDDALEEEVLPAEERTALNVAPSPGPATTGELHPTPSATLTATRTGTPTATPTATPVDPLRVESSDLPRIALDDVIEFDDE